MISPSEAIGAAIAFGQNARMRGPCQDRQQGGTAGVPDFGVIAAVSETLQTVLANAVRPLDNPPPTAEVSDLQGPISATPARLTLFLFEAGEDPSARNKPRVRGVTAQKVTVAKPPMALCLRYLITAWGGDRLTEHRLLGRTMQVLYDGAIISGPDLRGASLAGSNESLKVTLAPISLDNLARVWWAIQKPYRLSISYEVRVVNLDSETAEEFTPVSTRRLDYGSAAGS
jgi:Pvc16 N-terminal domain